MFQKIKQKRSETKQFVSQNLFIMWCTISILLSGCDSKSSNKNKEISLSSPWVAVLKGEVSVEGGLINIDSPRGGIVSQVLVEEGDSVKRNDLLAKIDDREAIKNLNISLKQYHQATKDIAWVKEKLAIAKREYERVSSIGHISIPQLDIDKAGDDVRLLTHELSVKNASLSVLGAQVDAAKLEVEKHYIRAPINGKIVKRDARIGEGISMYNVNRLFQLAPDTPRIIRAELDDIYAKDVKPGQKADVTLENDDSRVFKAEVIRLSDVVGYKLPSDDPADRKDVRILECVLSFNSDELRIGQRVLVKILH